MIVITIAAMLLSTPTGKHLSGAVDPLELNYRPVEWIGKRVRVCGRPFRHPDGQLQVYGIGKGESYAVDVDEAVVATQVGEKSCFDGVFRRRDGLTAKDIKRRGYQEYVSHVAADPYYILSAK